MFGPPFGGLGGLGGMGMGDLGDFGGVPMRPRRRPPMGGMPFPGAPMRGGGPGGPPLDGLFPLPGMMGPPPVGMPGLGPSGMGLPGMGPPGMGMPPGVGLPGMGMRPGMGMPPMGMGMGMPDMMGAPPVRGMEDPLGGPRRQRMPQGQGVGHIFDPSRAERNQGGREEPEPGRRHRGRGQAGQKYEKVKSLTPGGMSESITIVRNRDTGKLFVEKKVRTGGIRSKRAQAEIAALKACRGHPNLNTLIEYEAGANGTINIILEYCDGGSIDARIEQMASQGGRFAEEGVWHVLLSVAKALAWIHTGIKDVERDQPDPEWNAIAHLDLKPQNIFLSSERMENGQRRVILADFGCAVTFADIQNRREDERAQPCGTPGWYPPEGIARDGYGTKTDIWMLGGTVQVICLLMQAPDRNMLASSAPCGGRYSSKLQGIVREMTKDRFDKRPSARRIAVAAADGLRANQRR